MRPASDEKEAGDAESSAKKRPQASLKKTARKSSSKRSGPTPSPVPSLEDSDPNLEHGTWEDLARLEQDDDRPPTVFGLIPFSPEPEGLDAVMDDVGELAGDEHPMDQNLRPSEPDRLSSAVPLRSGVTPVKSEVEEATIPPPSRVATSRSSIKTERMSPSVLFSPDSPRPAPLPAIKFSRSRSSSLASDSSSGPVGLSALVPSPRRSASTTVESMAAMHGSVETLLDHLAQGPTASTAIPPQIPQSQVFPSRSHALGEAVPIHVSSFLPPPASKAHFRPITRPPATSETVDSSPPTPALVEAAAAVADVPGALPTEAPLSTFHRSSRKRSREESSVDADEEAVLAKLEDEDDFGEIAPEPSADEQDLAAKAAKKARKAERQREKRKEKRVKREVTAVSATEGARPSVESPPPPPSTNPASASAAERTALVRSKLQQWVRVWPHPEKVGRAIIAWLGEYPMSGLRMLLLKELFTQLLDLNIAKARVLCWTIIRLSEQTPGLLSDPPRNSFQRWLLQDIREADSTLYAARVHIYAELFALNPPYSYKTCLNQHLVRLTGPSPPTAADLDAFRTILTSRLTALETHDLLVPTFAKLRAVAASPHLAPDARIALDRLLFLDPQSPAPNPAAPANSDERSIVLRRCLDKLDELDEPAADAEKRKGHIKRVCKALRLWFNDSPGPLHVADSLEATCLATLALDRAHLFFLRGNATKSFFRSVGLGLHKALCDAIVTSDHASYTARIPVFADMLAATSNDTFNKAYLDGHLRRLRSYPRPPQEVIANLIDVIRPAGADLDRKGLLGDVFAAFRKLRDEGKLDIGGKMLINDLVYLRKSGWKKVSR